MTVKTDLRPPTAKDFWAGKMGRDVYGGKATCRGCKYSAAPDLFDGGCLFYEITGLPRPDDSPGEVTPPVLARYKPKLLSIAAWNLMDDHAAEVAELIDHFIAVGFAAGYAEAAKYYQKNESKEGVSHDDL